MLETNEGVCCKLSRHCNQTMKENILSTAPVQAIANRTRRQSNKRNVINFQSPALLQGRGIND